MLRRFLLVASALVLSACLRTADNGRARKLELEPCRLDGVSREAFCGTWEVFEDRAAKSGRKIRLRVAVIPALARDAAPDPLFLLAGGPGQAATEVMGVAFAGFERVARKRDLVLVDQRGTGSSNPLDCEEVDPAAPLAERLSTEEIDVEVLKKCLSGYDANPALYTTPIAMDDLDEVREALGYEQINLWGGSYGTRAALVYLRRHPEHVRAVVLDGVAPTGMVLPVSFALDGERALGLLFEHCENSPSCNEAFPTLRHRFAALIARLGANPEPTTLAHPLSGKPEQVTISRLAFTNGLRGLLYVPETASLVPLTVDHAEKGNFAPFVAQTQLATEGMAGSISLGMFYSVICSEDLPLVTEEQVKQIEQTFLGTAFVRQLRRACAIWPKGALPPGYAEPVQSDKPVLLLSGELDPVTPPAHAETARATLPNSLHLVVPGVGHGASYLGCMPRLISEFLDRGSPEGLDAKCLEGLKRPPFVLSFAGTKP